MFALNAIADTARIGDIWIYPRDTELTFHIPIENQYHQGSDRPTDYYSGVDIVSYKYTAGTETTEVQNGELSAGQYTIEFSEPLHTLNITGGIVMTSGANYAVITVPSTGNVILSGQRYIENRLTYSVRTEAAAGESETIKRYENYTLVSPDIGQSLAHDIYNYLQYRIRTEIHTNYDGLVRLAVRISQALLKALI